MHKENIEILGVAHHNQFPECPPNHPATQICQADKLWLGNIKCLKKVLQVCVGICITDSRVICTPLGRKLVVEGLKQIKVVYIVDDGCNTKKTACFQIPFVLFILLKDCQDKVVKVCAVIEDISVKHFDSKCILVTTVIFACPIFAKKPKPCVPDCGIECECNYDGITNDCVYKEVCYHEHGNCESQSDSCCGHNFNNKDDDNCYSVYGKNYYYGK